MNKIIEKFLQLTEYTWGYGQEHELLKYLPQNVKEDEEGNYFIEIGETETMFCAHLDTVAWEKEKVRHDFFKNDKGHLFVGTTGDTVSRTFKDASGHTITKNYSTATILGADDKAGVVILLNMIENNIPGLYYFFIGEESGAIGSKGIVRRNPDKFLKYKRCIAFDRRAYGSIISKQMGKVCCSQEFVQSLSEEFAKNGMKYQDDPFGIFTDSASFTSIIPECTNLSVGYFNEHTDEEVQNLTYLLKLCKTVLGINWESLPTKRNPNPFKTPKPNRRKKLETDWADEDLEELFIDVDDVIEEYTDYSCANWKDFEPEREMIYVNRRDDNTTSVYIHEDGSIKIGSSKFNDFEEFKDSMKAYYGRKRGYYKYKTEEEEEEEEDNIQYCEDCGGELDNDGYCKICDIYQDISDNKSSKSSNNKTNFEEGIEIQDFVYDVTMYAYDNNTYTITAREMDKILDSYNKSIESLIYWIFENGNNPDKTHGITWDDKLNVFQINDSI